MNESIEKAEMKKKTNWLYLAAMILVLILAVVSYMVGHGNTGVEATPSGESSQSEDHSAKAREIEEIFRQKVLQKEREFQQKNNELIDDFEVKLREIINRNFGAAENAIPSVVKDFSGFGACNKLCYKMVKSKITGSSDLETSIQASLGKVLDHCSAGTAEVDNLLKSFEIRLAENSNQFRSSIAEELNNPEYISLDTSALKKFSEDIIKIHCSVQQNVYSTVAAEVGVGLELIFIRSTCRILTSVFAKSVAKMAGSAAAGAICAAADGPIPIGDVIGGGIAIAGLAWTAYDIYHAMKVLPENLDHQLRDSVAKYRSEISQSAKDQAHKLLTEYENRNEQVVNEVSSWKLR